MGLDAAREIFERGNKDPRKLEDAVREVVGRVESARIDYVECRDAETLEDITIIEKPVVLAVAVFFGKTRLIDNMVYDPRERN